MADEYKKISGTETSLGPGAQLKFVELSGGGHALAIVMQESDIEIGAVEIKDATTDRRVIVTATGDLQITLGGEVISADVTGQGDVPITLDGETVVLGAGTAAVGKLAANSGVDIGDVDVITIPATAAEGAALPAVFLVVAGDDGTDTHPLQVDTSGYLKAILQTGSAAIGKLAANSGVDIGDVDILSIAAGETHVGEVGTPGDSVSQTPTVTAGAYIANDAVGGLLTFANAARVSGGGGVVLSAIIIDDAGQDAQMELWLFSESFTAMADNAPWAPSEADLRKSVGVITTSDGAWFAAGTPSECVIEVSQRYDLVGTSLFGQLVTRGTPTFAARFQ